MQVITATSSAQAANRNFLLGENDLLGLSTARVVKPFGPAWIAEWAQFMEIVAISMCTVKWEAGGITYHASFLLTAEWFRGP
jgi:hypothetical protein